MEDFDDYDNVPEDEVVDALRSLSIIAPNPIDNTLDIPGMQTAMTTPQLASRAVGLVKKYNKKHHFTYSVKQKIAIVQEAIASGNVRSTAVAHKVQPCQIRAWRGQIDELKLKVLLNPNAKTTHRGRLVEFFELENKVHNWVEEMRQEDIPVRTNNIIAQALSMDDSKKFKNSNPQLISDGFIVS